MDELTNLSNTSQELFINFVGKIELQVRNKFGPAYIVSGKKNRNPHQAGDNQCKQHGGRSHVLGAA
jgi:hypothetical protein